MEKKYRLIGKDQTKMAVHLKVGRWRWWGDHWRGWSWVGLARSRDPPPGCFGQKAQSEQVQQGRELNL